MTPVSNRFAAILLAAGASVRMGYPKPLLEFRGVTLLDRQISIYAPFCSRIIVVLGFEAQRISAAIRNEASASIVLNPQPEHGQLSSLQCGLRALGGGLDAIFFTPVDSPGVRGSTLALMIHAWQRSSNKPDLVIPRYSGRHGHPVLINAALASEFLAIPETATARDIIHAKRATTIYIDTEDRFVSLDIDTPEQWVAFLEETRS